MREPTAPVEVDAPDLDDVGPDDAEFIDFYRAHYPRAVRLAGKLVGPGHTAEDVVQDVFADIHRRFGQVAAPERYLNVAIVNRSRNVWRRRDHERQRTARLQPVHVPPTTSSELFDVLMKLPYRQRAVLVLRYWADWPDAEIADALRCRPGTVRQLAHRAIDRLRKEIHP